MGPISYDPDDPTHMGTQLKLLVDSGYSLDEAMQVYIRANKPEPTAKDSFASIAKSLERIADAMEDPYSPLIEAIKKLNLDVSVSCDHS